MFQDSNMFFTPELGVWYVNQWHIFIDLISQSCWGWTSRLASRLNIHRISSPVVQNREDNGSMCREKDVLPVFFSRSTGFKNDHFRRISCQRPVPGLEISCWWLVILAVSTSIWPVSQGFWQGLGGNRNGNLDIFWWPNPQDHALHSEASESLFCSRSHTLSTYLSKYYGTTKTKPLWR